MATTLTIGTGTALHLVNTDPLILTLGARPLCGGMRISGFAQRIRTFEGREATCKACLKAAAKAAPAPTLTAEERILARHAANGVTVTERRTR